MSKQSLAKQRAARRMQLINQLPNELRDLVHRFEAALDNAEQAHLLLGEVTLAQLIVLMTLFHDAAQYRKEYYESLQRSREKPPSE